MAMMTCGPCHFNPSTNDFSGKQMNDVPGMRRENLCQQYYARLKGRDWRIYGRRAAISDKDWCLKDRQATAFHQRPNLADDDLKNIIAFLKSDDAMVKPNARVPGKTDYSIVGKLAVGTATALPYHSNEIKKPENDKLLGPIYC